MPAAAASSLSAMVDAVYATFGVGATYLDRNGSSADLTIVVDRNLGNYGEVAQVAARQAVLCVRTSELPDGPRRGETFTTVDGDIFVVDSLVQGDELEHRALAALS